MNVLIMNYAYITQNKGIINYIYGVVSISVGYRGDESVRLFTLLL